MTEEALKSVIQKIYDFSGLKIASTQIEGLSKLLAELSEKHHISQDEFCYSLKDSHPDFPLIINHVTVNETYFFREEKQFDVLKNHIFPKFIGKKMNIWCGASSTGEEPISLLAMALSCNIDVTVFASDIDDTALEKIRNGVYTKFSFRTDGSKYHSLLSPFYTEKDDKFTFKPDFINRLKLYKYNLTEDTKFPFTETLDLIFLRNVFIYFDKETRQKISKSITSRLNENGFLFYSMNEIGCLDERIIPSSLYKTNTDSVYYFVKGNKKDEIEKKESVAEKHKKLENLFAKIKEQNALSKLLEKREKNESKQETAAIVEAEDPDIKNCFEDVSKEINKGNFENAIKIAGKISLPKNKFYSYFLQGYTEYHADNKENAERLFSTAEMLQKDFWPAYFYHGLVLKDIGKKEKADFCFKKCTELLDSFGTNNPYDFVLDSFSPSYIYSLCKTMMNTKG